MFEVVVCLEKGVSSEKLDQDATDGEEVAWIRPRHAFISGQHIAESARQREGESVRV